MEAMMRWIERFAYWLSIGLLALWISHLSLDVVSIRQLLLDHGTPIERDSHK
jgi:hypothetical protein